MISLLLVAHVVAALAVGPIFALPFLVDMPAALRAVLIVLRVGAVGALVTGTALWIVLGLRYPPWLCVSVAIYLAIVAVVGLGLAPAAKRLPGSTAARSQVRITSVVACTLTIGLVALMVLRPGGT